MNGWEIAILVIVCVAFVAAVASIVVSKIKHKGSCDCGGNCAMCAGCAQKTPDDLSRQPVCPHCKTDGK